MFTYHCDQCESTFSTIGNCRMHQYRKHNSKPEKESAIDIKEILSYEAEEIEIKVEGNLGKDLGLCLKRIEGGKKNHKRKERNGKRKIQQNENITKGGNTKEIIETLLNIHNINEPEKTLVKTKSTVMNNLTATNEKHIIDLDGVNKLVAEKNIKEPVDLYKFVTKDPNYLKYTCNICKTFFENNMFVTRNHVESSHFPSIFTYTCSQCGCVFSTWNKLFLHKSSEHKPVS